MMASWRKRGRDTPSGLERPRARAIDWDSRPHADLHQGARADHRRDAEYMAAPDQLPKITIPLSRGSHPYMVRAHWRTQVRCHDGHLAVMKATFPAAAAALQHQPVLTQDAKKALAVD